MKCSRTARGFAFGSSLGFVAEVNPKAGFGFRASDAFPVLKPIALLTFRAGGALAEDQRLCTAHYYVNSRTFVTESGFRFRSGAFIGLGGRTPVKRLWPVTSILVRVSLVHARQREVTNQQNRDRGHEHEDLYPSAQRAREPANLHPPPSGGSGRSTLLNSLSFSSRIANPYLRSSGRSGSFK
jgi:hypothetical protein